ncbi:MAG: magnesium-translocating P-type ATPase [Lachnospiraceae bacterium]|nr:magnesium-translocating P-type ATPase [Lachnospiraceae bacterium]
MKKVLHPNPVNEQYESNRFSVNTSCAGNNGLTQEQVIYYRKKYGSNEQINKSQTTVMHCVRRAFINPFSIILFVLAVVSLITDVLLPEKYGQSFSSVIIICVMLLLGAVVRLIQELRAKRVADRLTQLAQTTVSVCRDHIWQEVPSEELVVGDLVRIEAGECIPADIELIEAKDLFVSQSVITGESESFEKKAEQPQRKPEKLSDYINVVFQGTTVTGGSGIGVVQAVGKNTVYGSLDIDRLEQKQGFDRGASSIAWVLIRFMAILLPVVFLASGLTQGNWLEAFLFALSVAVGLTPEMLPMVVSACLAKGSHQMGKEQTVVKNINAMQTLGNMDVLCVDKTGTLTNDTIILEYYMDILGNESQLVLDYAFLNSHYHSGVKNHLDTAILKYGDVPELQTHFEELSDNSVLLDEQPFDYDHKYAGVLLKGEAANLHIIKGTVENVLSRCRYAEFRGERVAVTADTLKSVHAVTDELTEDGMKVLAVAYRNTSASVLHAEDTDFILVGYLAFFDAPKKSASETIRNLKKLNVDVRVLTGDDVKTTLSICFRLGIETKSVLTGADFEKLSENDIPPSVEKTKVFAELTPKQKALIIKILQKNGHSVGFMGDGMNDLPAELTANVGISVDTAADAVRESADVILLKKDLNVLERSILEGRKAFTNMTKYIKITASSNLGNIIAVVVASILLPFFPMTSLQLLLLNLLYDTLCLILPWDNVDSEQLEKPIRWDGKSLGRFMLRFGPISSAFDIITFAFLFFVLCPAICGGTFSQLDAAGQLTFIAAFQTGWFLESMWTQVLILHLLRTSKIPFIQSKPSTSVFGVTIAGVFLFSMLTVTPIGHFMGLTTLPIGYYVFLALDVLSYLFVVSVAKYIYFKKHRELL